MVQPIGQFPTSHAPIGPWHSPFEPRLPPPIPRLKPNVFALLTRWCFRNAKVVLIFWAVIFAATAWGCWINYHAPNTVFLPFPMQLSKEIAGAKKFASLERLQVVTLTHEDPQALAVARDSILAGLTQRADLFETVMSPGAGDFYDDNALLYRPLEEVQGRVAYALSLKPLFEAVRNAPDSASMATLLSGIAGTLDQGRDPQGLDEMLAEAAAAVQTLNVGEDHALDWADIAELEVNDSAKKLVINVVPRDGQEAEAAAYLDKAVKASGVEASISGAAPKPVANMVDSTPPTDKMRLLAAVLMGLAFAGLMLAITLGSVSLATSIFAPALAVAPLSFLVVLYLGSWASYWPVLALGILLPSTLSLSLLSEAARLSAEHPNNETAMMLAAQTKGQVLLWRGLLLAAPFGGLTFLPNPAGWPVMGGVLTLSVVGLAISFTLPAAMSRVVTGALDWRAQSWMNAAHRSLFETGRWQILSHAIGTLVVLACLFATVISVRKQMPIEQSAISVAVLANDAGEVEGLISRLRGVPSAAAVQWLGSFLPDQVPEKLQALESLKGRFPRIEPVGLKNPDDVRDVVETMQESLQQVAQAPTARASLKQAATEMRQSLAVLAATSDDVKLRELDNRLFGGFNRMADKAESLANLKPITLADLPAGLQALFGTPPGPYRLVVTPVSGVTPDQLAVTLGQLGLPVLHPAVMAAHAATAQQWALIQLLLAAGLIVIILWALAADHMSGFIVMVLVGLAAAVVMAATQNLSPNAWNLPWLLALCLSCGWLAATLPAAQPLQRASLGSAINVFLIPLLMLLAALPLALLGLAVPAGQALSLATSCFAASIAIGLFQRHGAEEGVDEQLY